LEEGYPVRTDTLEDGLGNRGLTGPGATGDANYKGCQTFGHNGMIIPGHSKASVPVFC
jgi:hypothetical protein